VPREVIVIDDLGREETRHTIECLSMESPIDIVYMENTGGSRGAPGSRNIGAARARGDLLAFLDDDDYWKPDYLRSVTETATASGASMILTALDLIDSDGSHIRVRVPPRDYDFGQLMLSNPGVLCSNVVVDRKAFTDIGGYDASLLGSCDKGLLMQIHGQGYAHEVVPEPLVVWQVHALQWSNDSSRILPNVWRLYRKYWYRMSPNIHIKMLRKLTGMYLQLWRNK
jgi:glycosyltransferase involved in cell wall biosynthesis